MRVQLSLAARLTLIALFCGDPVAGIGLSGARRDQSGGPAAATSPPSCGWPGPADGAYVYDLTAHQVLFSERATTMRPPASVEKLYTATTALERLGPEYRLSTTVLGVGQHGPRGRLGRQPLPARRRGPHLRLQRLHRQPLRRHRELRLDAGRGAEDGRDPPRQRPGDGRRIDFDSLRGEPSSDYAPDPFLEGSLSALAFNRGETGANAGAHAPAAYAARQLRAALRADGVHVSGAGGAATALPSGAVQLAALPSPTIAQLVGLMLPPSDNFFAEMLVKALGAQLGGAGTTPAGVRVVTSTISSLLGIHPQIVDGSGLSEEDRTSPYQVGDLLVALYPTPLGALLRERMAVAGHSGTLELRMRNTAAAGRCVGKTGTLTGVSNLVGYCPSSNGQMLAFAVFNDGIGITEAHTFQDHIAITLAGSAP